MAVVVPNIPYKAAVIDDNGFLTEPWAKWFRELFIRVGGSIAPSNKELAALSPTDLITIQASLTTLQNSIIALQSNDFNQGRAL